MIKFVLSAAVAAAAFAAPALAETPLAFTWEGHKIVGAIMQVGAEQVIKGKDLTTGRAFELHVKNGYVNGEIGDQLVSYPVPKTRSSVITAG